MSDCWHPKPASRPSFTKISEVIGCMLEDSVRQHYVDLNDPYLVMNTQRIESGESDYLAMLSPPDFEHLSSPHHYINDEIHGDTSPRNITDTPGYLCMKPNQIFSPRPNENVFNFDIRKHSGEVALGTELLPMLHTRASESDCETQSPTMPSFSNPSYHIPPIINTEKTDEDIVKSADNYVNMPQNKNIIKNEKNNTKNESTNNDKIHNYVNSNSRDWESIKV